MIEHDWAVTPERVEEAVRRIVELAKPRQVIVFGWQARGDQRPDSDFDLAVILEEPDRKLTGRIYSEALKGLRMSVDVVLADKAKYDRLRPWMNSVFNYIDQEGIVVYDRDNIIGFQSRRRPLSSCRTARKMLIASR